MTRREFKYHRRRRWHRFMGKLSGYVDDYMLAQLKIKQFLNRRPAFDKEVLKLAENSQKACQNIHKTLTTND